MVLLRQVIGDALRARRQAQHRTLREVSTAANVSLGYLSEIERGQKEPSSELLASICEALGAQLSEVLQQASETVALEEMAQMLTPVPEMRPAPEPPETPVTTPTVSDGEVSVTIRRDSPLRTILHAKRTLGRPGLDAGAEREREVVYAG
jgi:transcriptional regulator with XRE-family HTH domain